MRYLRLCLTAMVADVSVAVAVDLPVAAELAVAVELPVAAVLRVSDLADLTRM